MTAFAISFLFISAFTLAIGISAVLFVSFDAKPGTDPLSTTPQALYKQIRRVNTNMIETVDPAGEIQRWTRLPQ